MKTMFLCTAGTTGDIKPFLALARALTRQGGRPVLFMSTNAVETARQEGFEVRPVGPFVDVAEVLQEKPEYMGRRGGLPVLRELYLPFTKDLFRSVEAAICAERPAAVVSHPVCFGSAWAARKAGVPSVVVHLAPMSLFSPDSFDYLRFWKRMGIRALIPLLCHAADNAMRSTCRELHVPWRRGVFREMMQHGDLVLALWSPRFRGPAAGDSAETVICGFSADPAESAELSTELEGFLAGGEPPIAFGLGTGAVHVAGDFYEQAAKACRALGRRGLLLCGRAAPASLPKEVLALSSAPYGAVFPRCAAIVHHGGIGTVADCLRAGRPSVVVPFGHDQFDNADRLKALGVGVRLARRRARARFLAAALEEVLRPERHQRAEALAQEIRAEGDGAARAAEHILRLGG